MKDWQLPRLKKSFSRKARQRVSSKAFSTPAGNCFLLSNFLVSKWLWYKGGEVAVKSNGERKEAGRWNTQMSIGITWSCDTASY
jgi:hypothetical protein